MAVLIHGREFFFLLTSLDGMFFSMELDSVVLKISHMLSTILTTYRWATLLASSWSSVSMSSEKASKFSFFHKNTRRRAVSGVLFGFARHSISTCHDRLDWV